MITDEFGITQKEYQTIQETLDKIARAGYKILSVTVKMLSVCGIAGKDAILISPNSNLDELAWAVAHEIGHHNQPETWVTFNIWQEKEDCIVKDWETQAELISEYATKNPQEFWAERFASQFS